MKNEEIKATLLGQAVHYHNGFNGSCECFIVTGAKFEGNMITLSGDRGHRNYNPEIFINKEDVNHLVIHGQYIKRSEIDGCSFEQVWNIRPIEERKFQQRIDRIKSDIKRLKQELKQAQTDYGHYLVSSVRIEVMKQNNESNK